eukprot:GHVQ01015814.1.p1 GENE.GHVQ01015814.1~~GHVQ01015814.1.p1  ORF type:complete len:1618 (+),score=218.01 GHVQ01015814.1:63-4916(+)
MDASLASIVCPFLSTALTHQLVHPPPTNASSELARHLYHQTRHRYNFNKLNSLRQQKILKTRDDVSQQLLSRPPPRVPLEPDLTVCDKLLRDNNLTFEPLLDYLQFTTGATGVYLAEVNGNGLKYIAGSKRHEYMVGKTLPKNKGVTWLALQSEEERGSLVKDGVLHIHRLEDADNVHYFGTSGEQGEFVAAVAQFSSWEMCLSEAISEIRSVVDGRYTFEQTIIEQNRADNESRKAAELKAANRKNPKPSKSKAPTTTTPPSTSLSPSNTPDTTSPHIETDKEFDGFSATTSRRHTSSFTATTSCTGGETVTWLLCADTCGTHTRFPGNTKHSYSDGNCKALLQERNDGMTVTDKALDPDRSFSSAHIAAFKEVAGMLGRYSERLRMCKLHRVVQRLLLYDRTSPLATLVTQHFKAMPSPEPVGKPQQAKKKTTAKKDDRRIDSPKVSNEEQLRMAINRLAPCRELLEKTLSAVAVELPPSGMCCTSILPIVSAFLLFCGYKIPHIEDTEALRGLWGPALFDCVSRQIEDTSFSIPHRAIRDVLDTVKEDELENADSGWRALFNFVHSFLEARAQHLLQISTEPLDISLISFKWTPGSPQSSNRSPRPSGEGQMQTKQLLKPKVRRLIEEYFGTQSNQTGDNIHTVKATVLTDTDKSTPRQTRSSPVIIWGEIDGFTVEADYVPPKEEENTPTEEYSSASEPSSSQPASSRRSSISSVSAVPNPFMPPDAVAFYRHLHNIVQSGHRLIVLSSPQALNALNCCFSWALCPSAFSVMSSKFWALRHGVPYPTSAGQLPVALHATVSSLGNPSPPAVVIPPLPLKKTGQQETGISEGDVSRLSLSTAIRYSLHTQPLVDELAFPNPRPSRCLDRTLKCIAVDGSTLPLSSTTVHSSTEVVSLCHIREGSGAVWLVAPDLVMLPKLLQSCLTGVSNHLVSNREAAVGGGMDNLPTSIFKTSATTLSAQPPTGVNLNSPAEGLPLPKDFSVSPSNPRLFVDCQVEIERQRSEDSDDEESVEEPSVHPPAACKTMDRSLKELREALRRRLRELWTFNDGDSSWKSFGGGEAYCCDIPISAPGLFSKAIRLSPSRPHPHTSIISSTKQVKNAAPHTPCAKSSDVLHFKCNNVQDERDYRTPQTEQKFSSANIDNDSGWSFCLWFKPAAKTTNIPQVLASLSLPYTPPEAGVVLPACEVRLTSQERIQVWSGPTEWECPQISKEEALNTQETENGEVHGDEGLLLDETETQQENTEENQANVNKVCDATVGTSTDFYRFYNWNCVVVVQRGVYRFCYLNGVEQTSCGHYMGDCNFEAWAASAEEKKVCPMPTNGSIGATNNHGNVNFTKGFKGDISSVALWDRPLDSQEILEMYSAGLWTDGVLHEPTQSTVRTRMFGTCSEVEKAAVGMSLESISSIYDVGGAEILIMAPLKQKPFLLPTERGKSMFGQDELQFIREYVRTRGGNLILCLDTNTHGLRLLDNLFPAWELPIERIQSRVLTPVTATSFYPSSLLDSCGLRKHNNPLFSKSFAVCPAAYPPCQSTPDAVEVNRGGDKLCRPPILLSEDFPVRCDVLYSRSLVDAFSVKVGSGEVCYIGYSGLAEEVTDSETKAQTDSNIWRQVST